MSSVIYTTAAGAIGGLVLDVFVDDNPEKVFTIAGTVSAIALHTFTSYFGLGATLGGIATGGMMFLEEGPRRAKSCARATFVLLSGIAVGRLIEESYRVLV